MTFEQTSNIITELNIANEDRKTFMYACIIWYGMTNKWDKRKMNKELPYSAYFINRCIRKLTYNKRLKDGVIYFEEDIENPIAFVIELTLLSMLCDGKIFMYQEEPQKLIPQFAESLMQPFVPIIPAMVEPYTFYIPYDVR